MADPSTRHWPSSLLKAQKRKKQPKGAAGPRVPPAEEEDPRVSGGLGLWGSGHGLDSRGRV